VRPGDTIVAIDGQPAADWLADQYTRTSAATDGYRFDLAMRELSRMEGDMTLGLRDPDGVEREVEVTPEPAARRTELGSAPSLRTAGALADLGAPELYYINLDSGVMNTHEQMVAALSEAETAAGLVLDMRGYPGVNHYEFASRLMTDTFTSAVFRITHLYAPGESEIDESMYTLEPLEDPSYHGPIALLVGPHTVSAAENFAMMLVGAQRVTVVGQESAGTNGNITSVRLPGGFGLSFTGMEVLFPDRSQFHGVGIVPDVPVGLTPDDFRAGRDPELLAAIEVLR
jgi:C-terminal processing protease CtpA/Prc